MQEVNMSMQDSLSHFPELPEAYHLKEMSDSYSRSLDHEVCEWEQPYGYNVKPLEPMEYERKEHGKGRKYG
jgi:hypothetical protein